jgi:putative transposase
MIAERESAELAEQLIADTVAKHNILPGTLTLHADRGTSMRSKPVAALLRSTGDQNAQPSACLGRQSLFGKSI